ncbi:MAG TPA: 2-hydroxy-3-oxopropionate reductase [Rhodocyclaceae bacterium]|nr:MAG: 2-hydroxy-3-oxopropionate reductase [Rhodocyclales bacterium CG17_big_fil_post_rev_8_21_14_2_50_68_7]PIX75600.1 MAG: 2-hydroxy-3-oxopropionate reductase [Rhodocyclales bacterium CG_4_10_14_3_um_filter_68_10]PJA57703.1 MAG: 2-hydroxy-3-oxopropionate reductase [Rhodocyclales bacterium CG_4_9_14_3_um_filter_68_10]HCX33838.1 2-hydroxy-3-oxopropionate reductase [Rhodocyclaceae bacterium]
MEVGFIGLGLMGRPMALNLGKAGHRLHLWARRPEALDAFAGSGAAICENAAQVAREAEVVIICVADAPDVEEVCLGPGGIAESGRRGLIVSDSSTIAPAAARRIGERLAERGIAFLDAPVSGGEVGATNATLTFMVGGDAAAFETVRPLYERMGKSITHVGASGAGQVAKACNQIVVAITMEAVAEALTFAKKSGVDGARVREALLGGFAYSRILEHHGKKMLERNWKPGFKAWMQQKDLRIVLQSAHELGLALPGAAAVAQMFNAMVGSGLGEEDNMAVVKLVERLAGIGE